MDLTCHRCGEPGHLRAQCRRTDLADVIDITRTPIPRTSRNPELGRTWADRIRQAMGWHRAEPGDEREEGLREIARRQVQEARNQRFILLQVLTQGN